MTLRGTMDDQAGTHDNKARRQVLKFVGGLLIGLAASLPFAVVWPDPIYPPAGTCLYGSEMNPIDRIRLAGIVLPLPCMPTFMFIQPPVWGGFLTAGTVFGLIAQKLAGRGSRMLVAALGGFSFLILSYLGSLVVTRIRTPELPLLLSSATADPFAVMIFGVSLIFALAVGLALRTSGLLWRALVAAALTGVCYWFVAWLLLGHAAMIWSHDTTTPPFADSLPDLGNEMGPMMKTTLISNLFSGTIGGWITLTLLAVRHPTSTVP